MRHVLLSLIATTCCLAAAEGPPELVDVQPVAPDTLAVIIDSQSRHAFPQEPYSHREGDTVKAWSVHQRFLTRDGFEYGILIANDTLLKPYDQLLGEPLDGERATTLATWSLSAPASDALQPIAIHRKTKPTATARLGSWSFGHPQRHVLYLRFAQPLQSGTTYHLNAQGLTLDRSAIPYTHDPATATSEAIHVNHLGFRPDDPAKLAYVSLWMGTGGGYDFGGTLSCELINEAGTVVHSAAVTPARTANQPDAGREQANNTQADVYRYHFDQVTTPGNYRVRVAGLGCSLPFRIADDAYDAAYVTASRGLYHLRSGIALEEPYTEWTRPRCFHPDDGVVINATSVRSADGHKQGGVFKALAANRTGDTRTDAWGGYFDAGDWDRRTPHLSATMRQLELISIAPTGFASDQELNIPESGNGIPDIIDEAMWNLDCYRRMQEDHGGIPHGIESAEHPKQGEGSWQESLDIFAFAADASSSYAYVTPAARCAWLLRDLGHTELADAYQASALRAMTWADQQVASGIEYGDKTDKPLRVAKAGIRDAAARAAVELYRLTGEDAWHQRFLALTTLRDTDSLFAWQVRNAGDEAFAYATLPDSLATDETVRTNAVNGLVAAAEAAAAYARETGFTWASSDRNKHLGWGMLSAPTELSLVRAHHLTDREDLRAALVLAAQYGLGANPVNATMTTGLGHRAPVNALFFDALALNRHSPPGIVVYGPLYMAGHGANDWSLKLLKDACVPTATEWPSAEAYFDVWLSPATNEFTINQTMGPAIYAWGYLARAGR